MNEYAKQTAAQYRADAAAARAFAEQTTARTAGPWSADWYGLRFCVRRDTGDDHPMRCTEVLAQKFNTLTEAMQAADEANRAALAKAGAL